MTSKEYEELKAKLKKPPTEEARKAAAEAFRKYQKAKGGSNPTLVSLGIGRYPAAVPLAKIPDEMERNPEFYNLIKRIVTKGK